jgi:hypothetical protein
LFVSAFTVIGARRTGYDWTRDPVSSLAIGSPGWRQRANFMVTGALYLLAASRLARCPRRIVGPAAVPLLVGAAGAGLIGSGVFVTDPVAGFPPPSVDGGEAGATQPTKAVPSRSGNLHNLFAIPIFVGVPLAGIVSAVSSGRIREYRWAGYSVGSSLVMVISFVRFGKAFSGVQSPVARGGIFQRISVATGFGWMSALSLRVLVSARRN